METVAEIIGDERAETPLVERIEPPRLDGQPDFPAPGIYFGLPEDMYHSIHACSASGIKRLSVSSMDYWATSDLNPERVEERKASGTGEMTPMQLGQAYHSLICEGIEAFNQRFVVAMDKEVEKARVEKLGHPFCVTIADIRAAIDAMDVKPKGTNKDALADQLLELNPNAFIWDREVAAHAEAHSGKVMISQKLFRRIAIANAMILGDPQLKDAFTGGHAEVSIFWYDEQTGVPMKARLDYLKLQWLVDLKSFANKMGKPVQRAIDAVIAYEKYYIPVAIYLEGIEAVKKLVKEKAGAAVSQQENQQSIHAPCPTLSFHACFLPSFQSSIAW